MIALQLLFHIKRIQRTILRVKCIDSAQFYSKPRQSKERTLISKTNGRSMAISTEGVVAEGLKREGAK